MTPQEIPWEKILRLHTNMKFIIITSEELGGEDYNTFLQPVMEQRDALDHLFRAKAAELGISGNAGDQEYIWQQYQKVVGHLYRAFFDAADWLCFVLRDNVAKNLSGYSVECIQAAIPKYYSEYKREIIEISENIAQCRADKDIGLKSDQLLDIVEKYYTEIEKLKYIYKVISGCICALEDFKKRKRKSEWWDLSLKIFLVILGALVTLILRYLFSSNPI